MNSGADVFSHPWLGGLFGDDEIGACLGPKWQMSHMLAVEAAFSRALGQAGIVSSEIGEAAARHIETVDIDLASLKSGTAKDGLPVPDLVRQLRQDANPTFRETIHSGMTSQDVMDTALVLSLSQAIQIIERRSLQLISSLTKLCNTFGHRRLQGRTRMQSAQEITVANRLGNWSDPMSANMERLQAIKPRLVQLQLGGPVGNRKELGSDADAVACAMAEILGLGEPGQSWHTQRGSIVDFAGLLSLLTGTVGKMGQDIVLMSQQGIEEIELSAGGASSAMPHKRNPVQAELLVTLAQFNATQMSGMHLAMLHEQERSGTAWALEWMLLPHMVQATGRSLVVANQICDQITRIGSE